MKTLAAIGLLGIATSDPVQEKTSESDTRVEQVTLRTREILFPPPRRASDATTSAQVTSEKYKAEVPTQIMRERVRAPTAAQLYVGGRTAESSEALSQPIEGRTGATSAVNGVDRCDPARTKEAQSADLCARVIESRAAEFKAAEAPTLSPEQRLIVEQQLLAGQSTAATRTVNPGQVDPSTAEGQALASIVIEEREQTAAEDKTNPALGQARSEATNVIVNAIVAGVTGQPPQ